MTYKTILVHLNDSRRAEAVLEPATQLATRFNSHLIGLHVYAAVPASADTDGFRGAGLDRRGRAQE